MNKPVARKHPALLIIALLMLCFSLQTQAAVTVATDVTTASEGNVLLGVEGRYITEVQEALKLINGYRYEACQEGVINPSTNKALTSDDYIEIKWSQELEYIARIRAAESLLTGGHTRTNTVNNENDCFNITAPDGTRSYGEVLAWNNGTSMTAGIKQWYREKSDWVNKTGEVTGHYTQMIDPKNIYIGLGTFYSTEGYYYNCTAGQFSSYGTHTSTPLSNPGDVIQMLEIPKASLSFALSGETTGKGGDTPVFSLKAAAKYSGVFTSATTLVLPSAVTWSTSNPSVGTINSSGMLTVTGCGAATITGSWNGNTASLTFTSEHVSDAGKITTAATCTTQGTKTFTCTTCGAALKTETIAALGHSSDAGQVTTAATCTTQGTKTFTCTTCGAALKTESVAALGHTYDAGQTTTAATCTKAGVKTFTCTRCKATKTESIAATGIHTWDKGKVTKKASYTAAGTKTYTCSVCKKTKTETIAKLQRKGSKITNKKYNARFTFTSNTQLQYTGPIDKKKTKVTIPAAVKVDGKNYKVTSIAANALKNNKKVKTLDIGKNITKIGANAFYNCTKLKTITIRTKSLKTGSIGKKAFSKIYAKATIKVPSCKLKAYKTLLKKAGTPAKAKIKK